MKGYRMKVDAHQHFWRYNRPEYPWIEDTPEMAVLREDYLPQRLEPVLTAAGVDRTVVVQARQSMAETRWLLELAGEHAFIAGVVGWVDLCGEGLRRQLEELAGNERLCGVRHVVHDEPDDAFMDREDFRAGIGLLKEFGLTYDILIFPKHLACALRLVDAFPEQRFVVDHLAKPLIRKGRIEPWRTELRALADRQNAFCKLSGMVTEADWKKWKRADFMPYMETVLECFGPGRVMFGSDWPVCTVAAEYEQVRGIVTDCISRLSEDEQAAVMGETATRFYGLRRT